MNLRLHQGDNRSLFAFVIGSVFLGTPFCGTRTQTRLALFADLASVVGQGTNLGLVELLKYKSPLLVDLLHEFMSLAI